MGLLRLLFFRSPARASEPQHMTDLADDSLLKHIENVRGKVLVITGIFLTFFPLTRVRRLTLVLLFRWCKWYWKGMCWLHVRLDLFAQAQTRRLRWFSRNTGQSCPEPNLGVTLTP